MSGLDPCSKEYAQQTLDVGLPMTLCDLQRYVQAAHTLDKPEVVAFLQIAAGVLKAVKEQVNAPELIASAKQHAASVLP